MGADLALVLPAYVLGTFPTAALIGRRLGVDPTREGSGNPGASNVYRLGGRRAGLAVFLGDLAKGAVAAGAGLLVSGRPLAMACGAAAVLGHVLPVTRRLRGGRGVATAAGLAVVLFPLVSAGLAALWVVVAKLSGRASLASLVAAGALPALLAVLGRPAWEIVSVVAVAALVVLRHGANIARLVRGDEHRLDAGERTR